MVQPYKRTQIGYAVLAPLLAGLLGLLAGILAAGPHPVLLAVSAVLLACIVAFATLTIEVRDGLLSWRFGPGVGRKSIALSRITTATEVRNPWSWGWGIRLTPYGWLYNVSGLGAVEVVLRSGERFRLGSDEPAALARAILGGGKELP